jgi:hypothetical protein
LRGKFLYKRKKKTQNRGRKIRGEKQNQWGICGTENQRRELEQNP